MSVRSQQLTTSISTARDYEIAIVTWSNYLSSPVRAFCAATGFRYLSNEVRGLTPGLLSAALMIVS